MLHAIIIAFVVEIGICKHNYCLASGLSIVNLPTLVGIF